MTKILISTFGTRGDIQPFIALGKGLKSAGYDVAICTSEGFESFVDEHHLKYIYMNNALLRLTQAALGEDAGLRNTMHIVSQMMAAMRLSMEDEWNAALSFQPDLIIYHPKCFGSFHVAEKLGIPAMMSLPLPFYTPTTAFPVPFLSGIQLGHRVNRLTYRLTLLPNVMYGGMINDFRQKTLNLPRRARFADWLVRSDGTPIPVLYPYSQHILPVPADFPPHVHVTGYWFLDTPDNWQPDPGLVDFLSDGAPPVYIGFGSMGGRKGNARLKIVLEAVEKSHQRGVLISGWGGLPASDLPQNVFMTESVPHDWLFPRVAAVVHHGGAGTTAAGLRAGKPTVICPFIADQPFWGKLVYQRGIGPKPIPQSRLTAESLAAAISTAVHDKAMNERASEIGRAIHTEDGIAYAVGLITKMFNWK